MSVVIQSMLWHHIDWVDIFFTHCEIIFFRFSFRSLAPVLSKSSSISLWFIYFNYCMSKYIIIIDILLLPQLLFTCDCKCIFGTFGQSFQYLLHSNVHINNPIFEILLTFKWIKTKMNISDIVAEIYNHILPFLGPMASWIF